MTSPADKVSDRQDGAPSTPVAETGEQRARRADESDLIRQRKQEFIQKVKIAQAELTRQKQALARERKALDEQAAVLRRQRETLGQRAADLERRSQEIDTGAAALERRRADLEAQVTQLDARTRSLANQEAQSLARARQLDEQEVALRAEVASIEARFEELTRERTALDEQATVLRRQRETLEQRAADLERRSQEIETGAAALERRRADLEAQMAQLEERTRSLANQEAQSLARTQQLDEQEVALRDEVASIEARHKELAERDAEIEDHRAAVDKLYQQATESRQDAQRRQQEAAAIQARLEAREAELRREGLQTEIDREHLARDQAALTEQREELTQRQRELESEFERRVATEVHDRVSTRPSQEPAVRAAGGWRRGLVLCGVTGVIAGLAWFAIDQPRYRGLATLRISGERGSPEWVAAEHAEWLMSELMAAHWQGPPPVEVWLATKADGRVWARPLPDSGSVQLTFETADGALATSLLPAAAKSYSAYVRALPLERFHDPRLTEWNQQRAVLEQEHTRRCAQLEEIQAHLADKSMAVTREEAQEAFEAALSEFKNTVALLREQRTELADLQTQARPTGVVPAETFQQALADDAMYLEDLREFHAEARRYQTELAASTVLLIDPLQELREAVRELGAVMTQQRDLRPPPDVRTVLDECLAEVEEFGERLAGFSQSWDQRRKTIEGLDVAAQVVELVGQQNQLAGAARKLVEASRRVVGEVETRIENLSAKGDVGTRELVVTSTLRGPLHRVSEQIDVLAQAAGATDLSVNFRLDAHDRQVRGLRTRLSNREQSIRQVLQAEADRVARAQREAEERRLSEEISASEARRQLLVDAVVANLERLRELDARHQELHQLVVEQRTEEAAIERLEERLSRLEAERPVPQRDSVELAEVSHEQIAGGHRLRNAGLTGAATFAVIGLLLLLMFAQRSPRRPAGAPTATCG